MSIRKWNSIPKKVMIYVGFVILVIIVIEGCVGDEENFMAKDGNERMFVESHLSIKNPIAINNDQRPIKFGILTGKEYILQFSAQKFMGNVDGDMRLNIILPDELKSNAKEFEWTGKDRHKLIEIKIRPIKEGDYLIISEAKNLENNFSTVNKIIIHTRYKVDDVINITDS